MMTAQRYPAPLSNPDNAPPPPDTLLDSQPPPPGFRWEWRVDFDWRLAGPFERTHYTCRRTCKGRRCYNRPVAALMRSTKREGKQRWLYCEGHLYGRKIIDGAVQCPRLVPAEEEP